MVIALIEFLNISAIKSKGLIFQKIGFIIIAANLTRHNVTVGLRNVQ